jgi:hypothetical protein
MSVVGARVAVVSLGMCCQASFQIRHHVKLIADLSDDPTVTVSGMPFDWLICPPKAGIKILRQDAFYPRRLDELRISEGAYWPEVDAHFWHEFRPRKSGLLRRRKLDPKRAHQELMEKFEYMATKFRALATMPRLIFVMCNTQNNLPRAAELAANVDYVLSLDSIGDLMAQADAFFGRRCEYVFATYEKWVRGRPGPENASVFTLAPDDSEWEGDPAQWEKIFRAVFSSQPRT